MEEGFYQFMQPFYDWYKKEYGEELSQDEKLAVETFCDYLNSYTDSEAIEVLG